MIKTYPTATVPRVSGIHLEIKAMCLGLREEHRFTLTHLVSTVRLFNYPDHQVWIWYSHESYQFSIVTSSPRTTRAAH